MVASGAGRAPLRVASALDPQTVFVDECRRAHGPVAEATADPVDRGGDASPSRRVVLFERELARALVDQVRHAHPEQADAR